MERAWALGDILTVGIGGLEVLARTPAPAQGTDGPAKRAEVDAAGDRDLLALGDMEAVEEAGGEDEVVGAVTGGVPGGAPGGVIGIAPPAAPRPQTAAAGGEAPVAPAEVSEPLRDTAAAGGQEIVDRIGSSPARRRAGDGWSAEGAGEAVPRPRWWRRGRR